MEEIFRAPRTEEDMVLRSKDANKYMGRECKKCKGRVRYISNTHCVSCQTDGESRWARKNRNFIRERQVNVARAVRRGESW